MALEPGEHDLQRMKDGDGLSRHAVILTTVYDEVFHLVLTPTRAINEV